MRAELEQLTKRVAALEATVATELEALTQRFEIGRNVHLARSEAEDAHVEIVGPAVDLIEHATAKAFPVPEPLPTDLMAEQDEADYLGAEEPPG